MRKTKMAFLILAVTAMFFSCKKNDGPSNSDGLLNGNSLNKASVGDGRFDALGHVMDVTKDLFDRNNFSDVSIFDLEKMYSEKGTAAIKFESPSYGYGKVFSGSTAREYIKEVSDARSFKAGVNKVPKPNSDDQNFSGSLDYNNGSLDRRTFSSRYSFATFESFREVKRVRFTKDVSIEDLTGYLTPEFKRNVATMSAKALVERYGTHVMLDIILGGVLRFDYSGIVMGESIEQNRKSKIEMGISFVVGKNLGLSIGGGKTIEEQVQARNSTTDIKSSVRFYGGVSSGKTISVDKDGNTTESINFSTWESSVNDRNSLVVNIENSVFIYDFIVDPVKKAEVKVAVDNYIKENQIVLVDDYTSNSVIVNSYIGRKGKHHYLKAGLVNDSYWRLEGPIFRAFHDPYPGTVPLYAYFNQKGSDHYFTTNKDAYFPWGVNEGPAFYVYPVQVPGSIPIYEHYSSKGNDHFYTPDGRYGLGDPKYWDHMNGVAFYAIPL